MKYLSHCLNNLTSSFVFSPFLLIKYDKILVRTSRLSFKMNALVYGMLMYSKKLAYPDHQRSVVQSHYLSIVRKES